MRIKIILLFIILIISSSGCSPHIKNLANNGQNIICFGNSITQGLGANEGESYPENLEKLTGKRVINSGVPGDTTLSALKRLEKDILGKNAFLVIVELGGNDFLRRIPKKTTLENLEIIILKIQKTGTAVALCDISSHFFLSGYRNDFKRLARKTNSILIPKLLKGILDNPSLKYDRIHPNSKGYILIARRVYNEIIKYFKLN